MMMMRIQPTRRVSRSALFHSTAKHSSTTLLGLPPFLVLSLVFSVNDLGVSVPGSACTTLVCFASFCHFLVPVSVCFTAFLGSYIHFALDVDLCCTHCRIPPIWGKF